MQITDIQTGMPPENGRYVIFVGCASQQVREWCEPHIATFYNGSWVFPHPVDGWFGPLPPVKREQIIQHAANVMLSRNFNYVERAAEQEFDL